ncbi:MAG: hypothetical protein ABI268_06280 [Rhodanobacter sp.]
MQQIAHGERTFTWQDGGQVIVACVAFDDSAATSLSASSLIFDHCRFWRERISDIQIIASSEMDLTQKASREADIKFGNVKK